MRSIFLALLLANLLFVAVQFDAVRELLTGIRDTPRAAQMNAEKLRIIRDTSIRPTPAN